MGSRRILGANSLSATSAAAAAAAAPMGVGVATPHPPPLKSSRIGLCLQSNEKQVIQYKA